MNADTRRPGGRPSKQDAAALGDRLLDGARAIFGRKGVGNASLDEIALELGISKHTIYRRYSSKPALLEAVAERDIARFRQALSEAAGESDEPLERLHAIARRYVDFGASRDYSAFYLSVSAEAAVSMALRERLAAWSKTALEPLTEAVVSAQAAGIIQPGDATTIRDILVDLLEGANNRVRLGDAANDVDVSTRLFCERWAAFSAYAFVRPLATSSALKPSS